MNKEKIKVGYIDSQNVLYYSVVDITTGDVLRKILPPETTDIEKACKTASHYLNQSRNKIALFKTITETKCVRVCEKLSF